MLPDAARVQGWRTEDAEPTTDQWTEMTVNGTTFRMPDIGFSAPLYSVSKRENHGMGYHAHLEKLQGSSYVRTGHLFTRANDIIYAAPHGNKGSQLIDLNARQRAVLKEISRTLETVFTGIDDSDMLPVSRAARSFYKL